MEKRGRRVGGGAEIGVSPTYDSSRAIRAT